MHVVGVSRRPPLRRVDSNKPRFSPNICFKTRGYESFKARPQGTQTSFYGAAQPTKPYNPWYGHAYATQAAKPAPKPVRLKSQSRQASHDSKQRTAYDQPFRPAPAPNPLAYILEQRTPCKAATDLNLNRTSSVKQQPSREFRTRTYKPPKDVYFGLGSYARHTHQVFQNQNDPVNRTSVQMDDDFVRHAKPSSTNVTAIQAPLGTTPLFPNQALQRLGRSPFGISSDPRVPVHRRTSLMDITTERPSAAPDMVRRSPFTLEEELGKGSYAVVYVGSERITRQQFAIKVYKKEKMNTKTRRKIIDDEVNVLQLCRHKNIMRFYRKVETPTEIQLVLELVKGRSLGAYLKGMPNQCLPEAQAKPLLSKILDAMVYLHTHHIYHRDLKLDNILVTEDLEPTIIDFGFSCVAAPGQTLGLFCGTPNYMSPEIVNKKEYLGGPNDAWSFGVLFYRVVVGAFPFASKTTQELNKRINKLDYHVPRCISSEAKRVIESLLILEQSQRSTLEKLRSFRFFCN